MRIKKIESHFYSFRYFKCCSLLLALLLVGFTPVSGEAFDLLLGTGESGTFSHFAGRMLCRTMNSDIEDINCTVAPAPDDINNLTNIQGGSLDMALTDSRLLYDAFNKTGQFEFLDISYDNLRTLTPLCDIPVTLVVRDDAAITSLEDLKGKRLNAGPPGSLQRLAVDTVLKAKSWTQDDFALFGELPPSQSQDTMAFCHGKVQAMLHIGVHPDPSLQQLFKLCKAQLVGVSDEDVGKMVGENSAFWETDIAAGTYPAVSTAVTTFGTRAMLVVSEDFDAEIAQKIVEAIYANQDRLKGAHPALRLFDKAEVKQSAVDMQLHPGAESYFSAN